MAVRVMHRLAMEFLPMFRRLGSARRKASVVALAVVEMMIDVSIEVVAAMKPGTSADKEAA